MLLVNGPARCLLLMVIATAVGMGGALSSVAQEIKVASVAPDGSSWMTAMRDGAEQIRMRSDGRWRTGPPKGAYRV